MEKEKVDELPPNDNWYEVSKTTAHEPFLYSYTPMGQETFRFN